METPIVPPPRDYNGNFFKDAAQAMIGVGIAHDNTERGGALSLEKDHCNISKFLNRLLGVPVKLQNRLFDYFTATFNAVISKAKKEGHYDSGIFDVGAHGETVKRVKMYRFLREHATGTVPTELHLVKSERGLSWERALERYNELTDPREGFYVSKEPKGNKRTAILIIAVDNGNNRAQLMREQYYMVYK